MTRARPVLLLGDARPSATFLADAVTRLQDAGARVLLVTSQPLPAAYRDVPVDETRALGPAAQEHGPAFRRAIRRADPPERFWLHVRDDQWVEKHAAGSALVMALGPRAESAAHRLAERHPSLRAAPGIDAAMGLLQSSDGGPPRRAFPRPALPPALARVLVGGPGMPERRRYELAHRATLRLLRAGQTPAADRMVRTALNRLRTPRVRADLLGDAVSWALAHGQQPSLTVDAYAAELALADERLAAQRHQAAAESFEEAMRTAFHRVIHFDHLSSPLATDPATFTAPLRDSTTAASLRAARGRTRPPASGQDDATGRTRLLLATRRNADFLGEIREHLTSHPGFETRFVDFVDTGDLERFAKNPGAIVEQTLGQGKELVSAAEQVFRPHLDWADVVFVEWCTALAALVTQVDPKDTRVVVRMHSYEAFTQWPQLTDFTRVDDMVFVSEHLRDLAVAAIPALQRPDAPRLHVIANAMELRRFERRKPDAARFTLGVVGASKLVKDPRWAIEVLRHLRRHDERYRLLLIRGRLQDPTDAAREYARGLNDDLAELEPAGAVQVLGHTDDVPAALADVGVVVSSSVRESFHMGLVEGAASGAVPVVRDWPYFPGAARQLFPHDWVVDGPEAAADRILAATSSEQVWRSTGQAAAEHVVGRWDWQVVRLELERLLCR